ncbi:peptide deformylase [Desulfuromonas thiophila]|uniref:Peptide deformylase n=1 Tax=Desulfuromonas thiophila TaxID=57664 RepID=A0A1G6XHB3_9BACT|nr:peptide deformylase [Desulfuromonas thiophila]MDY0399044.1 peptide deformylase [Desulfuromonas thiophila]SDD77441.1 peptide deformylase [Desulfuromonas thiophila]
MAVREVLVYPDERLKQRCHVADPASATTRALVTDLLDTMYAAGHSVGIAAPQIGADLRVAVVDVSHSKLGQKHNHGQLVLINPEILERSGSKTMREGCMSVPDYTGNVERAKEIVVQFLDGEGRDQVIRCKGFEAVAIQHELDHLDGLLFLDRVSNPRTDVFKRK